MTKLTTQQKAGYGLGDIGFNLVWQAATLFLIFFYTDVAGISPEWAGIIYITASIWDAITDPIMGGIADRTRTRQGRYRPYLLWSAAPLALTYWLAFSAPPITGFWLIVWAMATHLLLRTVYTVANIPYSSLTARMTSDANERASLTGWRMQGSVLGGLTLAVTLPPLVTMLGAGDPRVGYSLTIAVFAVLLFLTLIGSYYFTAEPEEVDDDPDARSTFGPGVVLADILGVAATLRLNGPLARVFLGIIIGGMCLAMLGKSVPYYAKYVYGDEAITGAALGFLMLSQLIIIPFHVQLARRTSKRVTWLVGSTVMAVGLLLLFLNSTYTPIFVLSTFVIIGFGGGALGVMFWSMLPDTVEYNEWVTGDRNEAKLYAFASFAIKMATGIAGFLFGVMLGGSGFEANTIQSADTLFAIKAIMTLIPIIGLALCGVIMWGYPIDQQRHSELLRDIAARKDPTPALQSGTLTAKAPKKNGPEEIGSVFVREKEQVGENAPTHP